MEYAKLKTLKRKTKQFTEVLFKAGMLTVFTLEWKTHKQKVIYWKNVIAIVERYHIGVLGLHGEKHWFARALRNTVKRV